MSNQVELFRQGVLIGNWNEDEFGKQLAAGQSNVSYEQDARYTTVQKGSYTTNVNDGINQYYEQAVCPDKHNGVQREILFEHLGANTTDNRYKTTYGTTWSQAEGDKAADPSLRKSLAAQKKEQWAKEQVASKRGHAYNTETNQNYTEKKTDGPIDRTHHFTGKLTNTFGSPHQKLRLRENGV